MRVEELLVVVPGRCEIQVESKPWMQSGAAGVVAAMTPPSVGVRIWDELAGERLTPNNLPETDLYAISFLATSRRRAFKLAKLIRERGKKVVAGGIDATGVVADGGEDELLRRFDCVVAGNLTARLWSEVISDLENGREGRIYRTDENESWDWVVPRHDLGNLNGCFAPAVQTSAGCYRDCDFCAVNLVARRFHVKPPQILERELSLLSGLSNSPHLVVTDDSLGADLDWTKKETLPLLKDSGKGWFAETTTEIAEKLLEDMARSGGIAIYIGIESIFESVYGKSPGRERIKKVINRAHKSGMVVVGSFILDIVGNETTDTIEQTIEWAIEAGLDFVQLSLASALPGTGLRRKVTRERNLIDDNPEHFDGAWPTIAHQMSPEERIKSLMEGYKRFYSPRRVFGRLWQPHIWRQKGVITAAYRQIIQSAGSWRSKYGFEHWLATRHDPNAV